MISQHGPLFLYRYPHNVSNLSPLHVNPFNTKSQAPSPTQATNHQHHSFFSKNAVCLAPVPRLYISDRHISLDVPKTHRPHLFLSNTHPLSQEPAVAYLPTHPSPHRQSNIQKLFSSWSPLSLNPYSGWGLCSKLICRLSFVLSFVYSAGTQARTLQLAPSTTSSLYNHISSKLISIFSLTSFWPFHPFHSPPETFFFLICELRTRT
jgi:hypothetical protein